MGSRVTHKQVMASGVAFSAVVIAAGCNGVSDATDVDPIIMTKCAISGCHDGSLGSDKDWTNFETFHEPIAKALVRSIVPLAYRRS